MLRRSQYAGGLILSAALMLSTASITQAKSGDTDLLSMPAPAAEMTTAQWQSFSDNLVAALATDHEGLRRGAMRLVLQYADNVDVRGGLIDVMRIYRNHPDENVRRLAVVTLGSMNSSLAINYLRLNESFEQSPAVKRTIRAVLAEVG